LVASSSNLMTGFLVGAAGFDVGFVTLAAIAGVALLFFGFAMPETLPETNGGGKFSEGPPKGPSSQAAW
ncbi:hypothetical protein ACYOEI_43040, partial [Singulisphaera rosea]